MAPRLVRFSRHFSRKLRELLAVSILLLLVTQLQTLVAQTSAVPQAGAMPSPSRNSGCCGDPGVVERGRAALDQLLPMELAPTIEVKPEPNVPPAIPKVKIPQKYDVGLIGQRRVDQGVNFYSMDKEMAMGKQMAQELEARSQLLHDEVIANYVNELGQRLARRSDIKEPLVIKVVDSDEVNAFALPGGYFYVNTGLILAAQSEAELAAVMAHEIAHIAARHATKNMTKVQIWNLASIPMMFLGGPIGMAVREASSLAMPMGINKFSRDAEREADLLGIEYQYAAGYDPNAFVEFFERIKTGKKKPNAVAQAFSSHPMNSDRIKRAQKEIETMLPPRDDYVVDTSEFQTMQRRLQGRLQLNPAFGVGGGNGPVLRRGRQGSSTSKGPQQEGQAQDDQQPDDRPTLKRR